MSTGKNKLDTGLVRELAAILREADLGEIEVEHEGLRVRVSKPAPTVVQAAVAAPAPCGRSSRASNRCSRRSSTS
jgi:acetyl-CoA carboxylase biotin carboxyl carrier protein